MAPSAQAPTVAGALQRLADARARGASTRTLAVDIGVDHTTVGRWLRGKRQPEGAQAEALVAWAFGPHMAPAPDDYWRGVAYAVAKMSRTVADLSEELRDALDARAVTQFATAHAQTSPKDSVSSHQGTGAANRRTVAPRGRSGTATE